MAIHIQQPVFDPWQLVRDREVGQGADIRTRAGAAAVFVGCMRDFNQGLPVPAMTLEHYPGMTEGYLRKVETEARQRWELLDTLIVHRFGPILPAEPIVLVAVWSSHRDAAFAACRYLIDELKTRAPFWKQEQTSSGLRWVDPE